MKRIRTFAMCICALLLTLLPAAMAEAIALPDDSSEYSPELALAALKICTGHTKDASTQLLRSAGFDVAVQNNYEKSDGDPAHTCAYSIGVQTVEFGGQARELVVCCVRGTNAGEWYSNFDFAPSHSEDTAFAENFLFAAQDVFVPLCEVIDARDNPLILVAGHSRGAACANLLGVLLNDRYGAQNVYAYTFAAPMTIREPIDGCENIFNVVNPCDPVTLMPLAAWGYARAGRDIVLENDLEMAARVEAALGSLAQLAPDIPAYYGVRHSLAGAGKSADGLTTFEMMLMIAGSLTGADGGGMTSEISPESDFAPLLEMASKLSGSWSDNEILSQHMPQTYAALMAQTTA